MLPVLLPQPVARNTDKCYRFVVCLNLRPNKRDVMSLTVCTYKLGSTRTGGFMLFVDKVPIPGETIMKPKMELCIDELSVINEAGAEGGKSMKTSILTDSFANINTQHSRQQQLPVIGNQLREASRMQAIPLTPCGTSLHCAFSCAPRYESLVIVSSSYVLAFAASTPTCCCFATAFFASTVLAITH